MDQTVPDNDVGSAGTSTPPENATPKDDKQPRNDPRIDAMQEIEQQNNERIAKEMGVSVEELFGKREDTASQSTDDDENADDAVAEAERKRLADAAQGDKEKELKPKKATMPTVLEKFDDVMVKTVVDGKEVMRPLSDLVRIDQKESAINQRLEQAAHLRDEAQRVYGEAKAKATPAPANQQDASKDPQAAADDDAVAKEFLNAIYAGEDEKALSAVNKLFGKGRNAEAPATPDTEAIAQRVKQQIDTERALETFGSTYQEIVDDPYLADIADRFLAAELRVSGTSLNDALTKAGNATRDWVKQKAGSYTPPTPTTTPKRDEKLARKEQIDLVPSINASAASTEPAIQTTSDVIAQMRKERGLA